MTPKVYAGEPPSQISPASNTTTSFTKLEWQRPGYPLYPSNPYRVQVDDDANFPSSTINKDYYTDNEYYTPQLEYKTWYWRIKAKDSSGSWSDWSSVWSFTYSASTPSPSPTPTPSASSTPTPTPTSTPSPSSTPISAFTISNIPSQINSNQSFLVKVSLSLPNSANTDFYLKGAFIKSGSNNYFGLTRVGSSWVSNGSSYPNQYKITTDGLGNWSGDLEIKPDNEDAGFTGSGDYPFKVGRYTASGSGPTWSNQTVVQITPTSSPNSPAPSTTTLKTSSEGLKTPIGARGGFTTMGGFATNNAPKESTTSSHASLVAGTATSSASPIPMVKNETKFNLTTLAGTIFTVAGITLTVFLYIRSRKT